MEQVPKKTETIAVKRALRISQKIREAHSKLNLQKAWWTAGSFEFFGLMLLLLINFFLIYPIIGSHAVSTKFSGPIVPVLAKGISFLGPPFLYSVQLVNVIFFLGFPIAFYLFVKAIGGRKFSAFLAGLAASLPLFPFAKTRIDFGILGPESAYIASLTILPLALFTLLNFLRSGGIKNLIISCIVNTLLALISPFGIFIYIIMSVITAFSELLLGEGRLKIMRLLSVYVFTGMLSSFWYNPGFFFWMLTGPMGEDVRIMVKRLIPISFFTIPVLGTLGYLLFDRKPSLQPFFLALFFTIAFTIIVVTGGGLVPANPGRYTPVLGISIALLIGITVLKLTEFLKHRLKLLQNFTGLKDLILLAISALLAGSIFLGRGSLYSSGDSVLGIWDGIEKSDIWVAKDYFAGWYTIAGGIISFLGASALAGMYVNYKKFAKQTR